MTTAEVHIDFTATAKPTPHWKGPGYLPFCIKTMACLCASVQRLAGGGALIEAHGCRLVKVPTSDRRIQVRLECVVHHNVGGPLPASARVAGEPIDPRVLPDSHNTTDYITYRAQRGPVQP